MATKRQTAEAPKPVPFTCAKCNHDECSTQLRFVKVTIGWGRAQVGVVAPVKMCTKCGEKYVTLNTEVGDLVGLVPENLALENLRNATPKNVAQIDAAIEDLQEMRERAVAAEKAAKKAARKPAKKAARKKKAAKKRRGK